MLFIGVTSLEVDQSRLTFFHLSSRSNDCLPRLSGWSGLATRRFGIAFGLFLGACPSIFLQIGLTFTYALIVQLTFPFSLALVGHALHTSVPSNKQWVSARYCLVYCYSHSCFLGFACLSSAPRTQYAPQYQYQATNYQLPAVARGAENVPAEPVVSQPESKF